MQNWIDLIGQSLLVLIPVLTPVVIAGLKAMFDRLSHRAPYLIPLVAPIIGVVLDYATGVITGTMGSVAVRVGVQWAAVLGAAGVFVREVVDQARKKQLLP
jgi:hypothetical protein